MQLHLRFGHEYLELHQVPGLPVNQQLMIIMIKLNYGLPSHNLCLIAHLHSRWPVWSCMSSISPGSLLSNAPSDPCRSWFTLHQRTASAAGNEVFTHQLQWCLSPAHFKVEIKNFAKTFKTFW